MRMNYRNMLNEMQIHKGCMVSHQYSLMKPRPRRSAQLRDEFGIPDGCDPDLFRRVMKSRDKLARLEKEVKKKRMSKASMESAAVNEQNPLVGSSAEREDREAGAGEDARQEHGGDKDATE